MLVSQVACRRVLHPADDGGGTEFQGEIEGTGALNGVQKVIGEGVAGGSLPNPSRNGERGVGAGGKLVRQGQ